MVANVIKYSNLVTSEHADKPNFMAMVVATCQPSADLVSVLQQIPGLYDVDVAVGQQLDVVGQWVGVSRYLNAPLTGVYFAFDTAGVGFDQGVWLGPYDPVTGLVALPDEYYRVVIKVRILNNHWNGSKNDAYTLMNAALAPLGYAIYIEDHADLTMALGLVGNGPPTPLIQAMLTSGKLNVKPAGVRIDYYISQSVAGPIFGFDLNNALIGGFDTAGWAVAVSN